MPPVYGQNVPPGAVRCVGVGVCQTSQCTPDVGILVSTCRMTDVHDSAGKGSTSPVSDVCPLCPLDPAGMVPTSPVIDGCPPCPLSVLRSVRHEEKCHRPAT